MPQRPLFADASLAAPGTNPGPPVERWHIANAFCDLDVFAIGAAMHHVRFHLSNGKTVSPLAEATWHDTPLANVAPHVQHIGGEWPCIPFGTTGHDRHHHGYGSDNAWQLEDISATSLRLGIEYPAGHVVKKLVRTIELTPDRAAIDCGLHIYVNADCALPVGLHPIFKLPQEEGAFDIRPGAHGQVLTAPHDIAPRDSVLGAHERVSDTGQVRRKDGQNSNIWRQTSQLGEEIIAIFDSKGQMTLNYPQEGFSATLDWNARDFPHCLIWVANPGLQAISPAPHFQGIGIEPVNSYFDRNDMTPEGMLQAGVALSARQPWSCHYRLSGAVLENTSD
jgi:galactose mutarotase-like enzyme